MKRVAYRHELKYMINLPDWLLLRTKLAHVLKQDENAGEAGEYHIRSLYFDDYWQSAYEEKLHGILCRSKYRIRIYNCSDELIRLERKKKYGAYICKESAPLTREQVELILEGEYGFLLKSPHNLLREFYYECTSRMMRPKVIVDYNREPFIMEEGDVRITFDKHVRAGRGSFSLFNPSLPTLEVLPADRMILEVKYTEFLPSLVSCLLKEHASEFTAASKYVLCCDAAAQQQIDEHTEGIQWKRQ